MQAQAQRGMSLPELMIAMALGVMLTLGLATLFSQTRQSFAQDEQIATMQSGLRFAMESIVRDVTMAGFWGGLLAPDGVIIPDPIGIGTDCGINWVQTLSPALSGVNNASGAEAAGAFSCLDAGEFRAGTDVLAVKRTLGHAIPNDAPGDCEHDFGGGESLAMGTIYLADNGTDGVLFRYDGDDSPLGGCVENRQLAPVVYYIRDHSVTSDDGIPTLCRQYLEMGGTPRMREECLVDGIEQLQVEYGIDTNGNGVANRYASDPAAADFGRVTSVRIHLLARSLRPDPFYDNPKVYMLGDLVYEPDDQYYRRAATTTVVLRNPTNLRKLGN